MITNENFARLVDELTHFGELSNNLKCLHYGNILLESCYKHDCTLDELLNPLQDAALRQVSSHNFGRTIL